MSNERFPSQLAERFQIRLPDGLRDQIKADAEANGRSMNSEIIARLSGAERRTLRDWFAGQALAGDLAATPNCRPSITGSAERAYAYADAMLAQRQKP